MEIKEQHVSESQLDEVVKLIESANSVINLDRYDVKSVLVGKEGILYHAYKEKGVENRTFMKEFFDALKEKEFVQDCTSMLISISVSQEDSLLMEDLDIIHDLFASFDNEDLEAKWGIKNNEEGGRMTILTICTKATT